MMDDQELLRSYAEQGSEAAFGQLVSRYVNLVHSAALRRVDGNLELARDIAQIVFTDLAAKARRLPRNIVLAGWLHQATRFAAGHVLRAERRRKAREQEAALMNSIESEPTPDWDKIRPVLDAALDTLSPIDRDALVLRFFEQHSLAKVGQVLGLSEEAARKRVSRALDQLRANLARKGAPITTAALATAVSVNAVKAAPAGMAVLLTKAALAGAGAKAGTIFTLLKIATMTKLKVYAVSAVVLVGVATPFIVQYRAQLKLREADDARQRQADQVRELTVANQQLSNVIDQLRAASGPAPEQMRELMRLRGEVTQLRRQTNELARLAQERRAAPAPPPNEPTHSPEYFQQLHLMAAGKESDVKTLGLVFRLYSSDHNDQFPTNLEALVPYFAKQKLSLTGTNEIDLFYQGSLAALGANTDQSQIILFRDRQTWAGPDGKPTRVYGMADGSVQTVEAEDNFQAWEGAHLLSQANTNR